MTPESELVPCTMCKEPIRAGALKCRYCGARLERGALAREWYRVPQGKKLGGVCTGLAREWGVSVTIIRAAFIVATLVGGWGLPVYIALWLIMPLEPTDRASAAPLQYGAAQPGQPVREADRPPFG